MLSQLKHKIVLFFSTFQYAPHRQITCAGNKKCHELRDPSRPTKAFRFAMTARESREPQPAAMPSRTHTGSYDRAILINSLHGGGGAPNLANGRHFGRTVTTIIASARPGPAVRHINSGLTESVGVITRRPCHVWEGVAAIS